MHTFTDKIIHPFRWMYDKTLELAGRPNAQYWLMAVAFTESIFFPIPQDIMLIPMILAARSQAFKLATLCTIASVLGGMAGYGIGYGFYETIGHQIISTYGFEDKVAQFRTALDEQGFIYVFIGGFTPIPYKVITITSGTLQMDFTTFVMAALMSRIMRFFLVAWLLWKFGEPIKDFIDRYFGILTLLFAIIFIGGFYALKYL